MLELVFPSLSSIIIITGIAAVFGLMLSIAKITLKVEKDPRFDELVEALPGANCGACGLPGCSGYAMGILNDSLAINLCTVGGAESVQKIAHIMGVDAVEHVSTKARVRCQGGSGVTTTRFDYTGPLSCSAALQVMGGFKVCEYGCLGMGDCVRSCPFDAIAMNDDGIPVVDMERCTGCGNCVKACPRNIILLAPEGKDVLVMCMNREKAPVMKKGCSVGCTGCTRCVKTCTEVFAGNPSVETAITVDSFLASIDYSLCINCYKCAESCPVPVIHPLEKAAKKKPALASREGA